jgi:small-conductance mechanosensitive channel
MKIFISLIILFNLLFSLEVDTKMFEGKDSINYLSEIEKKINEAKINNLRPKKILTEERYYFDQIKNSILKKVEIAKIDLNNKDNKQFSISGMYISINELLDIEKKIKEQKDLIEELQNKLSFTKRLIENITKEDKDSSLLYQLQFAYFKTQKNNIENKIEQFNEYKEELLQYISIGIEKIQDENIEQVNINLEKNEEKIKKLLQQKAELQIKLEKAKIEENQINFQKFLKELITLESSYQNLIKGGIELYIKKVIYSLSNKNEEEYINTFNTIIEKISVLDDKNKQKFNSLNSIINDLAKRRFGKTKVIVATSSSQINNIFLKLKDILTDTLFVFNEQAITSLSLIKALFLIIFGFLLGNIYKKWLLKISTKSTYINPISLKISSNFGFYLINFTALMIAISSLGIDMSSVSLIVGALSIGIGFGLQTVISNFIAGIIIMFERTIRIGDVIEINELLKGTVSDVRIRSTTIKTFDNIDIIIPNSSFIQNNVINWTLDDPSRRLHIPFGVAYGTKIEKVKEVVLKELFESNLIYIRGVKDKEPEIRMEMMNSSSVDLELLVWVKTNDKMPNSLKSDFLTLIYNTLYKHNIEIPFPQLDIHNK